MNLHFEPITRQNRLEALRLEVGEGQENFIEPVSQCLSEARRNLVWKPVAICDGNRVVGFAMYGCFAQPEPEGQLWLDRLLIDKKYQGKGYGKRVVLALLDRLRTEYSCDTIYLLSLIHI